MFDRVSTVQSTALGRLEAESSSLTGELSTVVDTSAPTSRAAFLSMGLGGGNLLAGLALALNRETRHGGILSGGGRARAGT